MHGEKRPLVQQQVLTLIEVGRVQALRTMRTLIARTATITKSIVQMVVIELRRGPGTLRQIKELRFEYSY